MIFFLPIVFERVKRLYQLWVVLQLRIHNLDVLSVLSEQHPERVEALLDRLSECADRLRLGRTYTPHDAFCALQDL